MSYYGPGVTDPTGLAHVLPAQRVVAPRAPGAVSPTGTGVRGFLRRVGGMLLLLACTLLALSLMSWSVADPSLTHAASGTVRNWLGPLGAIVSDLLVQMLGLACIVSVLPPAFWALTLANQGFLAHPKRKLLYAPLAVLGLAVACSALPLWGSWPLHHGYGGALGDLAYSRFADLLAHVNAQRAGMAAGVFGLGLGGLCLQRSFGLSRRDLATLLPIAAMAPARPLPPQTIPQPTPIPQIWPQPVLMHTPYMQPMPQPQTYAPPVYVQSQSYAAPPIAHASAQVPAPARIEPQFTPPPSPGSFGPLAIPSTAPAVPSLATVPPPGSMTRQAWLRPFPHRAVAQTPVSPFTAPVIDATAAAPSPGTNRSHAPHFDRETAERSRTIASRFAPKGAAPSAEPEPAPQHLAPIQPQPVAEPLPPPRAVREPLIIRPLAAPADGAIPIARGGYYDRLTGGLGRPDPRGCSYQRPSLNLLQRLAMPPRGPEGTAAKLREKSQRLLDTLADFGVKGEIVAVRPGPVVTLFEFEPARGTKSSRVIGLADDIARSMSARAVRIAVVPGANAIGIELPNATREPVAFRDLLESEQFTQTGAALPLALGRGIGGEPVVADLARMPHLLVAGTTGAGKSVGVNAMILSLLFRLSPNECRLILIDPKMLELSVYNGIPHLLTPVVTDPVKAVAALNWAVGEMEERYRRMSTLAVRNIETYNTRVQAGQLHTGTQNGAHNGAHEHMPHIVIVVDEFADLMAVAGKEIEFAVQRLAQMARAAGIHLIMATQRPSVDIITGTIKANFPTRISFRVTSRIDSRTILNEQGAEQLLGQGDMLYAAGSGQIVRVHGPFVSDSEVEAIAGYLRGRGTPDYVDGLTDTPEPEPSGKAAAALDEDDLYDRAVALVRADCRASISYLQRKLGIGYNRAAGLIERMEDDRIVGPANANGRRDVLPDDGASPAEPVPPGAA